MKENIEKIVAECQAFIDDSKKDSKAARARMRKNTLAIAKLGKEFRRLSLEADRK